MSDGLNFVAIDFETANAKMDSACALGAVLVEDGKIVERRYSLIDPDVPFEKFCTYIHNITEERVKGMPHFSDIYATLRPMLEGRTVVAHNAEFDFAVLKASCEARGLKLPDCKPFCTVEMARSAWPELPKHRLNVLCTHFSIPLQHHNAVEDATACAQLLLLCAKQQGAKTVEELRAKLNMDKEKPEKKAPRRRRKPKGAEGAQAGQNAPQEGISGGEMGRAG